MENFIFYLVISMHGLHIVTILSSYLRKLPHNQEKKEKRLQCNEIQNAQRKVTSFRCVGMRFSQKSQLISICSMSTIETLEKGMKYIQF